MVKAIIFLEGGGDQFDLQIRCQEGFRNLFEKAGVPLTQMELIACGPRGTAYRDFKVRFATKKEEEFVALLIDSETPLKPPHYTPWAHLKNQPKGSWNPPDGATDDHVLLMTTCMETWIITDEKALSAFFGPDFQPSSLPAKEKIEEIPSGLIRSIMKQVTSTKYKKSKNSFQILGMLDPNSLETHLPSFRRAVSILRKHLS